MSINNYASTQLNPLLESLFEKQASGILRLQTQVTSWVKQKSCILILHNGALVFGDTKIAQTPSNQEFCQILADGLKPKNFAPGIAVANQRVTNPKSVRELLELLITLKVFSWQEVEKFITNQVILALEQFSSHPGEATWQETNDFDLCYGEDQHGLNWSDIQKQLKKRQQIWNIFTPTISSMDVIPFVTLHQLEKINDLKVKNHLSSKANGKQSLVDIAEKMGKDPLKIAQNYLKWAQNDWVGFKTILPVNQTEIQSSENNVSQPQSQDRPSLPTVLSVDDSPIIQTTIKRALKEQYNVLLSGTATEALQVLNQNSVQLMLLDLTMPDVDGLEFCKTIRKIPKFKDLPVIMVTARDGLVNKAKGHIAGTNRYLTKPFQAEELREIVAQYISK